MTQRATAIPKAKGTRGDSRLGDRLEGLVLIVTLETARSAESRWVPIGGPGAEEAVPEDG